jgi:hypothetical protein
MAETPRAEAPVHCGDVGFGLDQQTAGFKVAAPSRVMQWSALTAQQTSKHKKTEFCNVTVKISDNDEAASLVGLRARVRVALQKKTADVRAAIASSVVQ